MAGLAVSKSEIIGLRKKAESAQRRIKAAMAHAEKYVAVGVRTVEVGGTAFAFGMARGKYGDEALEVANVPVDLGAGLLMHVAGFAGVGGELASHLHNLGDGALAAYLVNEGVKAGLGWKQKTLTSK